VVGGADHADRLTLPSSRRQRLRIANACVAIAVIAWGATFLLIALRVVRGHQLVDCWRVYAAAGQRLWARQPLYDIHTIDDFQYFPHAAIVFSAVTRLGAPVSGIVWRLVGWGLFAHGLWRLCVLASPKDCRRLFLIATAIVIPPALTSVFNGQANLHIAALMMQATVDLSHARRRVVVWLAAGLALKPLMAVMMVLVWVVCPSMIWLTLMALVLLLALPLVIAPAHYVATQYHDCWIKMAMSATPDRMFEDLRGLVWKMGWLIPFPLLRAIAALAALGAGWLCVRVRREWKEPTVSLLTFAVAGAYLMLFNSRTQPNSYVILAPAGAVAAAMLLLHRRTRAALAMLAIVACWCGSAIPSTANWLKPLACLIFCGMMIRHALRPPTGLGLSEITSGHARG
jgi:hypothetical protein